MKLTNARPGARFRLGPRKIVITDHGTELHEGRMRHWVDYRAVSVGDAEGEPESPNGPILRAADTDPDAGWTLLRPGRDPDYHLEIEQKPPGVHLVPRTALGRSWCETEFGDRAGGPLPSDGSDQKATFESAHMAGLTAAEDDLLTAFLGSDGDRSPDAGYALVRLHNLVRRMRLPGGCGRCRDTTATELGEQLAAAAKRTRTALASGSDAIAAELGKVLVLTITAAQVASDNGGPDLRRVIEGALAAVRRQHRHILGNACGEDAPAPTDVTKPESTTL